MADFSIMGGKPAGAPAAQISAAPWPSPPDPAYAPLQQKLPVTLSSAALLPVLSVKLPPPAHVRWSAGSAAVEGSGFDYPSGFDHSSGFDYPSEHG